LRESFREGELRVRCLAPLTAEKPWTCPSLRLLGALDRAETLRLRVPAEVQLENWQSGHFRFKADPVEESGWQVLTWTRTDPSTGGIFRRPSARVKLQTPDAHARQLTWWQLGAASSTLTTQITYAVTRGRLFGLVVALPAEWQVGQVELTPAGLLRNWS